MSIPRIKGTEMTHNRAVLYAIGGSLVVAALLIALWLIGSGTERPRTAVESERNPDPLTGGAPRVPGTDVPDDTADKQPPILVRPLPIRTGDASRNEPAPVYLAIRQMEKQTPLSDLINGEGGEAAKVLSQFVDACQRNDWDSAKKLLPETEREKALPILSFMARGFPERGKAVTIARRYFLGNLQLFVVGTVNPLMPGPSILLQKTNGQFQVTFNGYEKSALQVLLTIEQALVKDSVGFRALPREDVKRLTKIADVKLGDDPQAIGVFLGPFCRPDALDNCPEHVNKVRKFLTESWEFLQNGQFDKFANRLDTRGQQYLQRRLTTEADRRVLVDYYSARKKTPLLISWNDRTTWSYSRWTRSVGDANISRLEFSYVATSNGEQQLLGFGSVEAVERLLTIPEAAEGIRQLVGEKADPEKKAPDVNEE